MALCTCFDNQDWVFLKGSLGKLALVSFLPFLFFVQILLRALNNLTFVS